MNTLRGLTATTAVEDGVNSYPLVLYLILFAVIAFIIVLAGGTGRRRSSEISTQPTQRQRTTSTNYDLPAPSSITELLNYREEIKLCTSKKIATHKQLQTNSFQIQDSPRINWLSQLPDPPPYGSPEHTLLFMQILVNQVYPYLVRSDQITAAQVQFAEGQATPEAIITAKYNQMIGKNINQTILQQWLSNPKALADYCVPEIIALWLYADSLEVFGSGRSSSRQYDNFAATLRNLQFPLGSNGMSGNDRNHYLPLLIEHPNFILAHFLWNKMVKESNGTLRFASPQNGTVLENYHMYSTTTYSDGAASFAGLEYIGLNRLVGLAASIVYGYFDRITDSDQWYRNKEGLKVYFGIRWILACHFCHLLCFARNTLPGDVPANYCECLEHGALGDSHLNNSVSKCYSEPTVHRFEQILT